MYNPQWPSATYGSPVHEMLHAISHLWAHMDNRFEGVSGHFAAAITAMNADIQAAFDQLSAEIAQMSTSLTDQFNVAVTKINADIDGLTTEVQTLLAGMNPGEVLTQAQVDSLTAIAARLEAIPALPAPPAPPVAA